MKNLLNSRLFFALLGAIFFLPFLGGVHLFDWDEINFAEAAREMLLLNNFLEIKINLIDFTEKPPLFFWLQALCMKLLGVGEYASRLPNALFGILTLPLLYNVGKKLHGQKFAFFWPMAWLGSILPHLYFKSGIIDPVFNFFIFFSIYYLIKYTWGMNPLLGGRSSRSLWFYLTLSGVSLGLAILTKGPAALIIVGLTAFIYWVTQKFRLFFKPLHVVYLLLLSLFVPTLWFGANYMQNGQKFIYEFAIRQWELFSTPDAGHGGFFGYHVVVLLFGCFPASIFAIQAMVAKNRDVKPTEKDFKLWMVILFWVVLILFSIVKSKIVHYSSMAYYPLTYLAAVSLYYISNGKWTLKPAMKFGVLFVGGLAALLTTALPFFGKNINRFLFLFEKDPFALENIQADVPWQNTDALVGILMVMILIFFIRKQKSNTSVAIIGLFMGTALWVSATLYTYLGKIERISQRAHIEFWKSIAEKDCYVATYKFKSYAHLFYSQSQPQQNMNYADRNWLFHGEIDKPLFISCRVSHIADLEKELPDAQFLYNKNGFYFYKRNPKLSH